MRHGSIVQKLGIAELAIGRWSLAIWVMGHGSNFPNFPNFRGVRTTGEFGGAHTGRPDPAASGEPLLAHAHAFNFSGGIEETTADAGFAGLAQDFSAGARAVGEGGAQPLLGLGEERARRDPRGRFTQQLVPFPLTLAVPDDAGDVAASGRLEAKRQRGGRPTGLECRHARRRNPDASTAERRAPGR